MQVRSSTSRNKAFSLIELIIVVVIIGIIAAIAIPKMSRGATGAGEAALAGDLQVLRNALELYAVEHNGSYPDSTNIQTALTEYSTLEGATYAAPQNGLILYGPYLKSVPPLPVGTSSERARTGISSSNNGAWIYTQTNSGCTVTANSSGVDSNNVPYSSY